MLLETGNFSRGGACYIIPDSWLGSLHLLRGDQGRGHPVHPRHRSAIRKVGDPCELDPAGNDGDTDGPRPKVIVAYGGSAEEMVRRRDEQCPMGRMGDAWDIAYAALFLVEESVDGAHGFEHDTDGARGVDAEARGVNI